MITSLLAALVVKGPGTVTLLYRPPLNKVYHYQLTMQMTQSMGSMMPKQDMTTSMTMDVKAIARKGDVTTVQTKTGNAKVTVPAGSPIAGMVKQMEQKMAGQTVTAQLDSHFKPVNISATGSNAAMAQGMGQAMQSIRFPAKPIRVGETWTFSMDMGAMGGAQKGAKMSGKLPIVCKLEAIEGSHARISVSMKGSVTAAAGPQGTMTMVLNTKGTTVIDIPTGTTVSSQGVSDTSSTISGQKFLQHMVQTMKLKN